MSISKLLSMDCKERLNMQVICSVTQMNPKSQDITCLLYFPSSVRNFSFYMWKLLYKYICMPQSTVIAVKYGSVKYWLSHWLNKMILVNVSRHSPLNTCTNTHILDALILLTSNVYLFYKNMQHVCLHGCIICNPELLLWDVKMAAASQPDLLVVSYS